MTLTNTNPSTVKSIHYDIYIGLHASHSIDYDDFMKFMCENPEDIELLEEKGLSLNWGATHLEQFLNMKVNFVKWYTEISDKQREAYNNYIYQNRLKFIV